ncbi:helix-turn-helix domain-containing protein [Paenibacillus arenilitoris]|nr:AraC family transcriptional regulator [Paenibacillus arenilitoris]
MQGSTLHRPLVNRDAPYVRTILHFEPRLISLIDQGRGGAAADGTDADRLPEVLRPFFELDHVRLRLGAAEQAEAERMLVHMQQCYVRNDFVGQNRFLLALADVLYWVYDLCREHLREDKQGSERERHVHNVIAYIERCYMNDITMDLLERELHLNKYYMSKVFKELTGTTIFKYLYNRRVNQAKVLFQVDEGAVGDGCRLQRRLQARLPLHEGVQADCRHDAGTLSQAGKTAWGMRELRGHVRHLV